MSSTTGSCLSIEDEQISHTRTINFAHSKDDVIKLFSDLREDHTLHELKIMNVCSNHRSLLVRFSMALRSYPTIKKLTFVHSIIQHLGPVFVAIAKEPLVALEFYGCRIYDEAAEDLNLLLQSFKIQELWFQSCRLDDKKVQDALVDIKKNRSLRAFAFLVEGGSVEAELLTAIANMLKYNRNLEYLSLTLEALPYDNARHLFRCIELGQSLKRLELSHQRVSWSIVERVVLMCWETPTLKELDFTCSIFQADALKYLLKGVSKRASMDTLNLSFINIKVSCPKAWLNVAQDVAQLRVKKLFLAGELLKSSSIVQQIARAGSIQHLDFSHDSHELVSSGVFELLQDHPSPIELILHVKLCHHFTISDQPSRRDQPSTSDQHNGLKSITCRPEYVDLVDVAEKVKHMQSLRKLTLGKGLDFTPEFFSTLVTSSLASHSLCHLSLPHNLQINDAIRKNLLYIRQALAINRVGGLPFLHNTNQVPEGLWARVLSRSTWDPDGIYFVVREMPDIVRPPMQVAFIHDDGSASDRQKAGQPNKQDNGEEYDS